jgi:hypothetical protein
LLKKAGFHAVRDLNSHSANHPFADFYAERGKKRFIIGVKTRNKRGSALASADRKGPPQQRKRRAFPDRHLDAAEGKAPQLDGSPVPVTAPTNARTACSRCRAGTAFFSSALKGRSGEARTVAAAAGLWLPPGAARALRAFHLPRCKAGALFLAVQTEGGVKKRKEPLGHRGLFPGYAYTLPRLG